MQHSSSKGAEETVSSQSRPIKRFLSIIFGNAELDYTKGNLNRAIILLSIPMVLEMMMESLFAVVDVYFVSKVSNDAVATVGITESVLTLVFAVAIGLSMATTAVVARRVGEKKPEAASKAAAQALVLGFIASLPIMVAGLFFAPDVLQLMGAEAETVAEGSRYTAIMLSGNIIIMFLFLINGIFRGAGNASLAMWTLWISNGINLILDPCFIFGLGPFPELGVTGAAVATNIGRGVGVLFQLTLLWRGLGVIRLTSMYLIPNWTLLKRMISISIGGIFQWIIATSSWILIVRFINEFGKEAVAGYTIGIRIFIFTLLPSWGISNAAATLVGQNLGAKQPERAEKSVWLTALYNAIFLGLISLVLILFAPELIALFQPDDPEVIAQGALCLRTISYGNVFFAIGMVITQSFNGAGDTRTPTRINLLAFWMIQIPTAYLFGIVWGFGLTGIYAMVVISESIGALIAVFIFKRGHWKSSEV